MRWRSPFGNCPRDCPINACALSSPLTVPHPWAPPGPLRARREGSPSLPLPARCLPRGARSSAGQSICLLSRWSQVRILPGAPLISAPFCPAAGLVRQDRSPLPAQNRRAPNAKPLCPSIPKLPDPIENSAAFSDHPPTRQACPHGVSETDPPQSMRCRVNEQRLPPLEAFEVRQLDGAFEAQPSSRLRTCSVRGPAPAVLPHPRHGLQTGQAVQRRRNRPSSSTTKRPSGIRANSIPLVAGPHPDRKPRGRGFLQTQSSETAGKPSLHFEESAGSGGSAPDAVALEWSRFGPARDTQRRQAAAVHALPQQRTAPGVYSVSELRQLACSFEN